MVAIAIHTFSLISLLRIVNVTFLSQKKEQNVAPPLHNAIHTPLNGAM